MEKDNVIDMTSHEAFMNDRGRFLLADKYDQGPDKYLEWILNDIYENHSHLLIVAPYKQKILINVQTRCGEGSQATWGSIERRFPLSRLLSMYRQLRGEVFSLERVREQDKEVGRFGMLRACHMEAMHNISIQITLEMEYALHGKLPPNLQKIVC